MYVCIYMYMYVHIYIYIYIYIYICIYASSSSAQDSRRLRLKRVLQQGDEKVEYLRAREGMGGGGSTREGRLKRHYI